MMQLIAGIDPRMPLPDIGPYARRVESLGYSDLHVPEMLHDPFTMATLALNATSTLTVRTGVALAFVRSPMATALAAWSLANNYAGRFALGLGPQIRPNIEERYGMEFHRPVGRMADYIAAVRACFTSFATEAPLDHEGEFYQLTRLQPDFRPAGAHVPEIWLGAVGNQMVGLAGRAADGLITHPTNSHRTDLSDRILPTLHRGARASKHPVPSVIASPLVATGRTKADVAESLDAVRRRIAFLYSTPAYHPTLDRLGYDDVGPALRDLIRRGAWEQLPSALPEGLVAEIAPAQPWSLLGPDLHRRYEGLVAGVVVRPPTDPADDQQFAAEFVAKAAAP